MNKLELELLVLLDFDVAVCHRAYRRYRDHLEKEMLRDGGGRRAKPQVKPRSPEVEPWTATVVAAAAPPKPNGVPAITPTARELSAADF
jgi:hypothetical protein